MNSAISSEVFGDGPSLCEPPAATVKRRSGVAEDPVKNRNGSAQPPAVFRLLAVLPQTGRTGGRPEPGAGVR
jgi:hypothetical protein